MDLQGPPAKSFYCVGSICSKSITFPAAAAVANAHVKLLDCINVSFTLKCIITESGNFKQKNC